jgi:hypothetical protein
MRSQPPRLSTNCVRIGASSKVQLGSLSANPCHHASQEALHNPGAVRTTAGDEIGTVYTPAVAVPGCYTCLLPLTPPCLLALPPFYTLPSLTLLTSSCSTCSLCQLVFRLAAAQARMSAQQHGGTERVTAQQLSAGANPFK